MDYATTNSDFVNDVDIVELFLDQQDTALPVTK